VKDADCDAAYFAEKAKLCFQLAKYARGNVSGFQIAKHLDALGDEFLHKGFEMAALAGSWQWTAQCGPISARGVFVIRKASGTRFSGSFLSDFAGSLSDGHIEGDRISFSCEPLTMEQQRCKSQAYSSWRHHAP
jgi:hypothetical protein